MPENNNKGYSLDADLEAYLDLLDSESGKKRPSRDFGSINESLSHEKEAHVKFIDIEEEETIKRPAPQRQPGKRPAPPKYKEKGQFVDAEERKKQSKSPVLRWFYNLPKKKQTTVKVLSVFLCLAIIFGSALGIFINSKFNMMGDIEDYTDEIYEEEEFSDISGNVNASNFKDALKNWATTGNDEKMSSKNVVNVLLIGADSREGSNSGNTDVMMLVSLNKKTKQIKLVSFMRDSYLYIEGKNNSYCAKLNAAFSMGGPEVLMKTIENNYKIEIDDFVMVNFESFKSIIEAMGGVTVEVQKYEANYANNRYNLSMPYGESVTLNGEEALAFCRIRGCDADGDVSRTRRQRQVINAMIDRVKSASVSDLNSYLNALLPYIYTGFSKSEVLSLGMRAITNGWASYERSELQIPTPETRASGSMGSWIWVIDYQLAAQTLQMELYGQTNITLEDGRTTLIDVYNGTTGSGTTDGGSSTPLESVTGEQASTTVPETQEQTEPETQDFEIDMGSPDITVENTSVETTAAVTETVPDTEIQETIGDDQ